MRTRMFELDKIKYVWMDGKWVEWSNATVHISSAGLNYGDGVFEGIRAYWSKDKDQLFIFRLRRHLKRLFESAKVLRMDISYSRRKLEKATRELMAKNEFKEDIYIRPLVYFGDYWREGKTRMAIFGIPTPREARMKPIQEGVRCCVSGWRKIADAAMPPRIKTCGNYASYHLARKAAKAAGFYDAILLTWSGKVSEATSANIFLLRDGKVATPPVTADILEGITRESIILLLEDELGMKVQVRDVDKTELYLSDEVFACGTFREITPIVSIDHIPVGEGKVGELTKKVQKLFFDIVEGKIPKYADWVTGVY